jgi:transcriptional regulator with XRE-family HTH domain
LVALKGKKMNNIQLRALRKKAKLTQRECWEIVGRTSGRQYKNWESGKAPIPFAECQLFCIGLVFFKHLAVADVQEFMPETLRLAIFPA